MICIRSIELTNVKNVGHGRIEFGDSPFGTRVTGIYGQNGSGKTTVVDAFECVRALMCGEPLGQRSADLIGPALASATIEVELEVTRGSSTSLGLSDAVGASVAQGQPFLWATRLALTRRTARRAWWGRPLPCARRACPSACCTGRV